MQVSDKVLIPGTRPRSVAEQGGADGTVAFGAND